MNDILKLYLYDLLFHNIIPYDVIKTLSDMSFNKLHKYYIVLYLRLEMWMISGNSLFLILLTLNIILSNSNLQGNYKSSAYDLSKYYNMRSFIGRVGEK